MEKFKHANEKLTKKQQQRFYVGREDFPEEPKCYIIGDILRYPEAKQREYEAEQLRNIGLDVYSASEDDSINDKSKNTGDKLDTLAEKIVLKDWDAIAKSNLIIAEPVSGVGSMCETAQINGFNYLHKKITNILEKGESGTPTKKLAMIKSLLKEYPRKKVMTHIDDMRLEAEGNLQFQNYTRTEFSINQYLNGIVESNTNGEGIQTTNEIFKQLNNKYNIGGDNE